MVVQLVSKTFTRIFGSRNDRLIKGYLRRVEQINALEPQVRQLTDAQLRDRTQEFRQRLAQGERVANVMPEIMATAREVMDRAVGIRNILNPAHQFDPARLPAEARPHYLRALQQAEALAPTEVPGGNEPVPGWMQVEIPVALYEAVRAIYPQSRPPFRTRPFDVQLIGGMVLGEGRIAEMKTGEGKTIVGPLACYVACVENLQCHVVTVNDYLVQRDRDWVFPFYYWLGLNVGAIHPFHMQSQAKKAEAYHCDVVYGTNSEFGFDYLRDNMKLSTDEQVQKRREFCIIDEVDSILIDEARTPLIISGPAHEDAPRYELADQIARHLMQKQREWDAADQKVKQAQMRIKGLEGDIRNAREKEKVARLRQELEQVQAQLPQLEAARDQHMQYYEVEPEKKAAHLTHEGVAEAQKVAGIGSFYVGNNIDLPHLLENALRAHVVYQRDREYVVENGEVIIVDEFTGRKMIGRQWSDGLHQAVETKERVKLKEETQTLATVTIQNFFKLYRRLAGMTGTAITESTEFNEIYRLDVVCIPTNVPVVRGDYDDVIYLSEKDKWTAIIDEIEHVHDIGRPVLVGTASVDNSERLSELLTRRKAIKHEVLNAKQHEREAHIVAHAGELGAVMIATNMAGRGTDIKLAPLDRAALIRHWQQRNLLPSQADPGMSDEELVRLAYRHLAVRTLGLRPREVEEKSDDDIRLMLLRHWTAEHTWTDPDKAQSMSAEQCMAALDRTPNFRLHRLQVWKHVNDMGGLHIVGTERHESRRIDNQLRGRAGRQGDRGSSRFFISLEDPLMKNFAGNATMAILSKLGMKEGDAIEHPMLTRSVGRAQRKVEERNYEIRKNLLEYDEVMEYQRNEFYGIRQAVLEGRNTRDLIFAYLTEVVRDAVDRYLDPEYVQTQVAEWCRQTLDVSVETGRLPIDDLDDLQRAIRTAAQREAAQIIDLTLPEYMSDDMPAEDWDLRGLSAWAMSKFEVDLKPNQLRTMNPREVQQRLTEAAEAHLAGKDLSGLAKFMDPLYAENDLASWVENQFGTSVDPHAWDDMSREQVADQILEQARAAYRRREIEYPIDFTLDIIFQMAQQDGPNAARTLCEWVRQRYGLEWTPEEVMSQSRAALRQRLVAEAQRWREERLPTLVDQALAEHGGTPGTPGALADKLPVAPKPGSPAVSESAQALAEWVRQRFGQPLTAEELAAAEEPRQVLLEKGEAHQRVELTHLERFVLLQILDAAWKDHLYAMDQLKSSVGLRGYAERDPRIEYKREGSAQFQEMQGVVRNRVTGLIFRARLTANVQARNVYEDQEARHPSAEVAASQAARTAASQGTAEQRANLAAATQAGAGDGEAAHLSRRQRRAQARTNRGSGEGAGGSGPTPVRRKKRRR